MGPGPLATSGLGLAVLIVASAVCPERLTVFKAVNLSAVSRVVDRSEVVADLSVAVAAFRVRDMVEKKIDRGVIGYAIDSSTVLETKDGETVAFLVDGNRVFKITDRETIAQAIDSLKATSLVDSTLTVSDYDRHQVELIIEQTLKGC
jgi:hypothetical protein